MRSLVLIPLRFYKRFISPILPPMCRFEPTCSVYMMQAIEKYGIEASWTARSLALYTQAVLQGAFIPHEHAPFMHPSAWSGSQVTHTLAARPQWLAFGVQHIPF